LRAISPSMTAVLRIARSSRCDFAGVSELMPHVRVSFACQLLTVAAHW